MNYVTVRDRLEAHGLSLDKIGMWKAGNTVRDLWLLHPRSHGKLPLKDLRPKATGRGSHCFAVYPAWFTDQIDSVVVALAAAQSAYQAWLQSTGEGRPRVRRRA
jgi:hypothetical protein